MATEIFKQTLPEAADLFKKSALQIWEKDGLFLICFTLFVLAGSFLLIRKRKRNHHH